MYLKKYIVYSILLLCVPASAQIPADYGFYQVPNVPFKHIYSLLIDHKGFIWFSNELGVFRYDGKSCTPFYNEKRSSLAIGDLTEDRYGRIWCRNFNDQIFYIEDGKMKLLEGYDQRLNISWFAIAGDELVAKCSKGLFIHNLVTSENNIIHSINKDTKISPNSMWQGIRAYDSNTFFLFTATGRLRVYKYSNNNFTLLKPTLKDQYSSVAAVNNRYLVLNNVSKDNITYFEINGNSDSIIKRGTYKLASKSSYVLSSIVDGKIWIHRQKQSFIINDTHKVNNLSLTSLLKDKEGNTWASSLTHGLLLKKRAAGWQFLPGNKETGYSDELVSWHNKIIAGTSEGTLIVTDTAGFLNNENKRIIRLNLRAVTTIFVEGDYLYAYGFPYLVKLDRHFNIIKRFALPHYIYIRNPTNLANKMLIFSSNAGLVAVPPDLRSTGNRTGTLPGIIGKHFSYDHRNGIYLNAQEKERANVVYYDSSDKILYAGLSSGLYAYSSDSIREIKFKNRSIHSFSLIHDNNKLFISTLNNGILAMEHGQITQLKLPEIGAQEPVVKMKLFGTHLWMISTNNISLYDIKHNRTIGTTMLPPLKGIEVLDLLEWNDQVYFSTREGIYKVPLKKNKEEIQPLNYLLSVVVNSGDTIQNQASLPYNKNSLQFNLTALYYFNPEGVYFKYRLLGNRTDTTWKYSPSGLWEILFPNIMPGNYIFEAIAYTANGLPAKKKITFSFTINKVWWQQWWFILSMIVVVTTLTYVYISMHLKSKKEANRLIIEQLKHERERLEHESERLKFENAANESELKALKSQMSPHFISNSLNDIQELILLGDKHAANEQLSNFATLSRLILSVSGKKFIPLATELYILTNYLALEEMCLRGNFSYDIIMEEEMDEWAIQIPPMIIQPFVENSVKHGLLNKKEGDRRLSITFKSGSGDQHLVCTVTDNGISRAKAAEMKDIMNPFGHDSFSTEAVKKRLNLMGLSIHKQFSIEYTDLKDEQGKATGTTVTVSIPIYIA